MRVRLPAMLSRWVRRRVWSAARSETGLVEWASLPEPFRMPLLRTGLDPVPDLARVREREPVSVLGSAFGMTVWLVSGYEQVRGVLADTTSYSSDIRALTGTEDDTIGGLGFTDPPEHTRLRRLLTPEFTARRLSRLAPRIERIVHERLDELQAGDDEVVDFVEQFAFPVPFQVICELLGLDVADREQFRQLGRDRFDVVAGGTHAFAAMSQSRAFLLDVVARQRKDPGDGLIGSLIRTAGDEVDDVALAGLADGVFTGGYETSASMLALGIVTLLESPGVLAGIRADESAVNGVVEELLRYLSVVQIAFPRFARTDLDLFGRRVRAGDVVICSLSGANRDPVLAAGPDGVPGADPDTFAPFRAAPTAHVAFGHGLHRCVGAELARLELRIAFTALAHRLPDLSLAIEPAALKFRPLSIVYGLDSLPVHVGASSPVVAG